MLKKKNFQPRSFNFIFFFNSFLCVVVLTWWSPPSQFAGDRTHEWGCARLFLTKFSATTPPSKMLLSIFEENISWIKKFPQERKFFNFDLEIFWWKSEVFSIIDFCRFLRNFRNFGGFLGFSENRDFLHFPPDRGWAYELWHIGGQKKGHFRRFCGLLPIFF